MKILLAVDKQNDPALAAAYLAQRLRDKPADIDVLTVIPDSENFTLALEGQRDSDIADARRKHAYREACALTANIVTALRRQCISASVRTHIACGDPADVIMAQARCWRSELLLIGAPRRQGLLTAFRLDGVTRRLMKWCDCPLELLRPVSLRAAANDTILMPLPLNTTANLAFQQLQALPWPAGGRVHLLGVVPPSFDECQTEASAAAVLLALQEGRDGRARAAARLDAVGIALGKALRGGLDITHEVVDGKLRDVIVAKARELHPTLIVCNQACLDGGDDSLFGSLSPAALTISVACAVLLLQDDAAPATSPRQLEAARILKFAR